MKSKEEIEKLLHDFGRVWPAEDSVATGVMQTIESPPERIGISHGPSESVFSMSRNNRRLRRLAIIFGSATAILAAFLWTLLSGQNQLAFAQVIEKVRQTKSMTSKVKIEGAISEGEQQYISLPDGKLRGENSDSFWIIDIPANKQMYVDKKNRTAQIMPLLLSADASMPENNYAMIENISNQAVEILPDDEIGGRKVNVFYSKGPKGNGNTLMKVWVDPTTKLPLRMEQNIPLTKGRNMKVMAYDIQFDQPYDPSLFSFTPPEGFELQTSDAIQPQIPIQSAAPSP
jgi:outer membrane lipoprotein-sorting protein